MASIHRQSSIQSVIFARKDIIGDLKINVTEQPVDVLQLARAIADARSLKDNDDAFMIFNLDAVYERVQLWQRELPHVQPFYAVKCNSDETMLHTLAALGVGFDCASSEEIDLALRAGAPTDHVIYANTCKSRSYLAHADECGVRMMTFDSAEELRKIARVNASNLIGNKVRTTSRRLFIPHTLPPVRWTRDFHVGSGCNDPSAFRVAIQNVRNLFDIGRALGHKMHIVDIGGGFPGGDHQTPFEKFASIIRSALAEFFPDPNVRFIAEPGRFFAARTCTLVASVITRKAVAADLITKNANDAAATGQMYYINDGVFGSFNCKTIDHVHPVGRPLFDEDGELCLSTIWGPSCDSQDKVEDCKMVRLLDVGDWLIYEEIGAYTCAASITFNGFPRPTPIYVISERTWKVLGI